MTIIAPYPVSDRSQQRISTAERRYPLQVALALGRISITLSARIGKHGPSSTKTFACCTARQPVCRNFAPPSSTRTLTLNDKTRTFGSSCHILSCVQWCARVVHPRSLCVHISTTATKTNSVFPSNATTLSIAPLSQGSPTKERCIPIERAARVAAQCHILIEASYERFITARS